MENSTTRKIQITGGSTYIVSLPPEWIKKHNLRKGSEIIINEDDSDLIISSSGRESPEVAKKLTINEKIDESALQRILTSMYISSFDTLAINTKDKMTNAIRENIKKFSKIVMGAEIIEETSHTIVIQNVLNTKTFPLSKALRRMSLNVSTMIEDTIKGIKEFDDDLLDNVIERDDEVDRYQWYVYREVRNRCEYEDSNVFYLVLSRILERIADHAVNICNLVKGRNTFTRRDGLISGLSLSLSIYNEAMEAFYAKNFKPLNDIINRKNEVIKMKYQLINDLMDNASLNSVSEEISRIGLYGTDIAELTMDLIMAQQSEISV